MAKSPRQLWYSMTVRLAQRELPEFWYPCIEILRRLPDALTGHRIPLHRDEDVAPFFIVGPGRSGNTLLRRILTAHPEIHVPPESYFWSQAIRGFRLHADKAWDYHVRMFLSRVEYMPYFEDWEISTRDLVGPLCDLPEEERSLARMFDVLIRHQGRMTGQTFSRWGDKTPSNFRYSEMILKVFPRSRFVSLVRDGVDVASSYRDAEIVSLERGAEMWRESLLVMAEFQKRHPDICMRLRYEDLVTQPEEKVRELCAFIGIDYDPAMLSSRDHTDRMQDLKARAFHANVLNPISNASIGKGRRKLPDQELRLLQRLIGTELVRFGYEPAHSG